jgi:hypothetical protein
MGAVEAALYNKPVIITDYGAPREYIKTKCDSLDHICPSLSAKALNSQVPDRVRASRDCTR